MLDPKDFQDAQNIGGNTANKYIKIEILFNSLITEFSERNKIEELMQCLFVYIITQMENTRMAEGHFSRLNHAPAHQLSYASVDAREVLY